MCIHLCSFQHGFRGHRWALFWWPYLHCCWIHPLRPVWHNVCKHVHCAYMHCILYMVRPITSETMLILNVIVSESWGNDIRRWFSPSPSTFVYGQAGSDDETWKEFLLGGEASTPVNTDSLKLSLDCLTHSAYFLPPSTIASLTIWANLWPWCHTVWRACRCDGLLLQCGTRSIFYRRHKTNAELWRIHFSFWFSCSYTRRLH